MEDGARDDATAAHESNSDAAASESVAGTSGQAAASGDASTDAGDQVTATGGEVVHNVTGQTTSTGGDAADDVPEQAKATSGDGAGPAPSSSDGDLGVERATAAPSTQGDPLGAYGSGHGDDLDAKIAERDTEDETGAALGELSVALVTLVAVCALTYLIPGLGSFRPWRLGDDTPLASLFTNEAAQPTFAGTGAAAVEATGEGLSDAIAASLGEEEAPVVEGPRIRIRPEEYAGIDVRITDADHRGLNAFFEALRATALADDGEVAMTRVSHYGDSSIATDLITSTMRRRMQRRFGDGGHGFVLMGNGYLAYRHRDVFVAASDEWSLREIVRRHDRDGFYGYGGVQFRGRPGARTRFATVDDAPVGNAVNRFEIWYQRHRRGGDIHYRVDRGPRQVVSTRQDEREDAVQRVDLPLGAHELEVRFGGHGQTRLYGAVLENVGAGVVYDSLGLVGARAARLLYFDAEHIARQLEMRQTNLLILGFGGNEASDRIQRERYQADFEAVIERMRGTREDLSCLVFAPLDQAKRDDRGRIVSLSTMEDIVEAQRAAAEESGCAFFDTWDAMGGEGAMGDWFRARPRLAMSDLRHATPAGYEVIGNLFYKALLAEFARWLESRQSTAPSAQVTSAQAP
ncbi:MAG: GDSL-type esterase/lipase family protein [Myxococcota bacterium]